MCGIVGLHGPQNDDWIDAMNAVQGHRGPDGSGIFRDRDAGLAMAMRRLAIIDPTGGVQPMVSPDGRYVLVYNGEIFNAPQLRRDMEAAGERFQSEHADTETLLRLLIRRGAAVLPRLNGMFAFGFYDRERRVLLCGRDRLGIKPLHYHLSGGRFAFASEIKSLLRLPFVDRRIDRQSLFDYLSLMYVPGERTILQDIVRLPPGCCLTYRLSDGDVSVERWWTPAFRPDRQTDPQEWPQRIYDGLSAAVGRWSQSDAPMACALSGGLDSASITGLLAQRGASVRTVSLGFSDGAEADRDERALARQVAEKWGTEHHEVLLTPRDLWSGLGRMVWHLDEPYAGGLPSWAVFEAMAGSVKVAFTGIGGDELFGNYGKWLRLEGRWAGLHPALGRREADSPRFRRCFHDHCYNLPDAIKRRLFTDGGAGLRDTADMLYDIYSGATGESIRDRLAVVDLRTQLPDEFLLMTDRFSMAHGLEGRTPFLDNELVDLALSVPSSARTARRDLKGLLRRAVAPLLPAALLSAPKKGFGVPLRSWLNGPLRPMAERLLSPEELAKDGVLRSDTLKVLAGGGRTDRTPVIWALLMFQLWRRIVLENGGARDRGAAYDDGAFNALCRTE